MWLRWILRWTVRGILASLLGTVVAGTDISPDLGNEDDGSVIDERPSAVWRSVAEHTAMLSPILSDADEASLGLWARYVTVARGPRAGESIGSLLCSLPALDRTRLIASWATSRDDTLRLGLARALSYPIDAVGLATAIELLARDGDPEVRDAAQRAARLHGSRATA